MNQNVKPESTVDCCQKQMCGSTTRNNYFEEKRLSVDSFQVEQNYHIGHRRLLNRAIHGWGIVYGFDISPQCNGNSSRQPLVIGDGMAIDECGRELIHCSASVQLDDLIFIDQHGNPGNLVEQLRSQAYNSDPQECWLVSAHYAEKPEGKTAVNGPCDWQQYEWDRTTETVVFSIRYVPHEVCFHEKTGCCDGNRDEQEQCCPDEQVRDPHKYICEQLTKLSPGSDVCELAKIPIGNCESLNVDLKHGVPLACIEIVRDDCGWMFDTDIEICGPRRFVKRNDLLYDLLPGQEMTTRICDFGWKKWHRAVTPIPVDAFGKALKGDFDDLAFWVKFTRPVKKDTLLADCFVMRVLAVNRDSGWLETLRVPIQEIKTEQRGDSLAEWARIVVDPRWYSDNFERGYSRLENSISTVEIEVRGDFVIDCNGCAVDANAVGKSVTSTGNGIPGGNFISTFRIGKPNSYGK